MSQSVEAYPLQWPAGRARTRGRSRANFHRKDVETKQWSDGSTSRWKVHKPLTIADSRSRVEKEVNLLGGRGTVISSNLELRNDGLPRSNQREPADPGVAVYFQLNGQSRCVSCDKWDRAADNLAAIAKFVEAMRGQLRWGVGDVNAMFSGFKALPDAMVTPPPMTLEEATAFLKQHVAGSFTSAGILNDSAICYAAYRAAARKLHPDSRGAEHADWHRLQQAKEILEQHHAGRRA